MIGVVTFYSKPSFNDKVLIWVLINWLVKHSNIHYLWAGTDCTGEIILLNLLIVNFYKHGKFDRIAVSTNLDEL